MEQTEWLTWIACSATASAACEETRQLGGERLKSDASRTRGASTGHKRDQCSIRAKHLELLELLLREKRENGERGTNAVIRHRPQLQGPGRSHRFCIPIPPRSAPFPKKYAGIVKQRRIPASTAHAFAMRERSDAVENASCPIPHERSSLVLPSQRLFPFPPDYYAPRRRVVDSYDGRRDRNSQSRACPALAGEAPRQSPPAHRREPSC